jgi:hypothetical protein
MSTETEVLSAFSASACPISVMIIILRITVRVFNNAYPERKSRITRQYTGWQQNFVTQEVLVCDKGTLSDKTAEIGPN